MKSTKNHPAIKAGSLLLLVQWLVYLVLASGLLVPTTVVHAAACTTVSIVDNVVPLGGVNTFYEDTGTNLRNAYTGYTVTNTSGSPVSDMWVTIDNFSGGGLRINKAITETGIYHLGPLNNGESKQVYFYLRDAAGSGDNAALNETYNINLFFGDPRAPISSPEICEYQDTINKVADDISANPNKVYSAISTPNPPQLGGTVIITKVGETGTIGAARIFYLTPAVFDDFPASALRLYDVHTEFWNGTVCPNAVGGVPAVPASHIFNDVLTFTTPGTANSCYRTVYSLRINDTTQVPTVVYPVSHISSGTQIKHTGAYPSDPALIPPIQNPENKTTISKTVDLPNLPVGGTATYTITVDNSLGTSTVTLDQIYDQLPNPSVTYLGPSTFNGTAIAAPFISGTTLIWTMNFTVLAGQMGYLVYKTNIPNTPGVYNNSAYGMVGSAVIDTELNLATFTPAVAPVTVGSADVSINKTDNPDPVNVGSNLTYTLLVGNAGPSAAANVSVSDPLPANVTYVSATPSQGSCSYDGGSRTVSCSLGTINNGSSATISIVVTPTSAAGGTTLSNTATVSTTTYDPVAGNNTSTQTTAVVSADLSILKTDDPDPVNVGQNLTYTLAVTNNGPSTATSVNVSDPLPANVTYESATPSQGSCSYDGGSRTVSCSLGTINNGSSATITVVITPTVAAGGTTLSNTATVSSAVYDPVAGNNSSNQTTAVVSADVAIVKTDAPDPVYVGNNLTYTLTVTNNGPSTATGVSVSDPLPANVTYVSATPSQGSCNEAGGTVTCALGNINNGSSATITIVVTPTTAAGGTTLSNTATVSSTSYDPVAANNTSTQLTTVNASADVAIVKTDDIDPINVGQNLTYTLAVTNNGPSTATGVSVSDPLPANVTFVSATPSQGSCIEASGTVNCTLGTINSGSGATITIVITPTAATGGTTLSNTATVSATTFDPVAGNNSSTQTTAVLSADLSILKSDNPDPVNVGQNLTYTLTVTNNGPSTATGVSVSDTLPANVTYVSATPSQGSCLEAAGTVNCTLGTINSGSNATITIVVTPTAAAAGTTLSNNATVSSSVYDPLPANNTANQTTTVVSADVSVVKTDSPDPVIVGNNLTYTILVHNEGPSTATGVTVSDTLPANVTFVSVSPMPQCSQAGGAITCNLGSIAPGLANDVTITVVVTPTTAAGGTILSNTATVNATSYDPVPGNNSSTQPTTVNASADISVVKTDNPDPVNIGQNLTYTLLVHNAGPSTADGVVVSDTIPANTTFVSVSPMPQCSEAGGTITCNLGSIASGSANDVAVTIVVTPTAAAGGTTLSNTATVSTTTPDPVPGNNTSTTTTNVLTSADISITKSDDPDPVKVGENLTYTLLVHNDGPSPAADVIVTDTLPANVNLVSVLAPSVCSYVGGTVTCPLGTINPGALNDVTIIIVVTPTAAAGGTTLSNTANVSTTTTDPVPGNNSDTEPTVVTALAAELSVIKSDSADPIKVGDNLTYTLLVHNAGPDPAVSTTVTDTLPANVSFVSAVSSQGSCIEAAGTVTCTIGTINPGALNDVTISIVVTALPAAGGTTLSNTAAVSSSTADPDPGNNSDTEPTVVNNLMADLSVVKSDSADPIKVGDNLTYTLLVHNAGPDPAVSTTVTDTLPANVSYVSATSSQGSCSEAGGTVTCNLGTINPGGVNDVTISIVVTALPAAGGTTINNNASVTSTTIDPVPGNNTDNETTVVNILLADLSVVKSDSADPIKVGDNLTYTLLVHNAGPDPAVGVTLSDTLPANVSFVSVSPTPACSEAGGTVSCNLGTINPGGANDVTVTIVVMALPAAGGTTLSNTASVSTTTTDPVPGNNSDTEPTVVNNLMADLSVVKSDSADPIKVGDNLTYTLLVHNAGPDPAVGVTLSDTIPANVSFVSVSPTPACSEAGGTINCSLGTINPGAANDVTVTIVVTALPAAGGTTLSNTAFVSTTTADPVPGNNSDTEPTDVNASADLSVVKTDNPDPVNIGQNLTYTLLVHNAGPSTADGVVVSDTIPANTTFVSVSPMPQCSEAGGTITCNLGSIASGSANDVAVTIVVTPTAAAGGTTLSNTATVSTTTPDPVPGNNSDTEETTVPGRATLTATKIDGLFTDADGSGNASAGDTLRYAITLTNNSTVDATDIAFTDTPDANTSLVVGSVITSQGTVVTGNNPGDTSIAVNVGDLAAGGAFVTIEFKVVIHDPLPAGTYQIRNQGIFTGTNISNTPTDDPDYPNPTDPTITPLNVALGKSIFGSNQAFTLPGVAAIGEILTYEVNLQVNPGTLNAVTLVDSLPLGMAYHSCDSIVPASADLSTDVAGGFTTVCGTPTIEPIPTGSVVPVNQARKITFNLGNLTNSGADVVTLRVRYRAVVLDNIENQSGDTLTNNVIWYSGSTVLLTAHTDVDIAEPAMNITKTVSQNTAYPGTTLTYRIKIEHTSTTSVNAYDLRVIDVIPAGLSYVPGSFVNVSGQPAVLNDAGAPTLVATWAAFENNGTPSIIEFKAIFVGGNASVSNTASLSWTSLPGDISAPQTPNNALSRERDYDPGSPADVYQDSDAVTVTQAKLPATGFAPSQITPLSRQPTSLAYSDLGAMWLEIPKLNLKTSIIGIPAKDGGWDITWLGSRAGWLEGTAFPTWKGNSVITGHIWNADNTPGVFINLTKLSWGDEIIIRAWGQKYIYRVQSVLTIKPDAVSQVLQHENVPALTLLTCSGFDEKTNTYRYREIVRLVQVRIEPE